MKEVGIFQGCFAHLGTGETAKLDVGFDQCAIGEIGKVEKTHPEAAVVEFYVREYGMRKAASGKKLAGEIHIPEFQGRKIETVKNLVRRQRFEKLRNRNVLMGVEHSIYCRSLRDFGQMGYYVSMCWKCGKAIIINGPIGRTMTCESCGQDLRSCKNCRFFSPGSYHDCAERVEDFPSDKERANFCDSFQLNPKYKTEHSASGKKDEKKSNNHSAFDNLFNT